MPSVDYEQHGSISARHRRPEPGIAARIHAALGDARTIEAFWRRPQALLDPGVEERIVARLSAALESGAWDAEQGHLRDRDSFDGALRLVISE